MSVDSAPVFQWLTGSVSREIRESIARLAMAEGVRHVAVMPDVHLSGDVCVGIALASDDRIFPGAVGRDIGCGMASVRLRTTVANDAAVTITEHDAMRLLRIWSGSIPPLMHRKPQALADELLAVPLSHEKLEKGRQREGAWQWGTLGRGNHFLELETDAEGQVWLTVHCGSRGMGQLIAVHHESFGRPTRNHVYFDPRLIDSLCEESPSAYKNLREVMQAQHDLVRTERQLNPHLVYKGK